jgi:hypothetical protein
LKYQQKEIETMKSIIALSLLVLLCSCAAGPVQIARNEAESLRTTYDDPQVQKLYKENEVLLRRIYLRFDTAHINAYKQGIGITALRDQKNQVHPYIMIGIRPSEIYFNENQTTPEQRFSEVLKVRFPKYLSYIKKEDFDRNGIEGLDLAIYWPVRDYSQCNTYGGFVEYTHVYLTKGDVGDIIDGKKTFAQVVENSKVITSLNLQPAKSVRPLF